MLRRRYNSALFSILVVGSVGLPPLAPAQEDGMEESWTQDDQQQEAGQVQQEESFEEEGVEGHAQAQEAERLRIASAKTVRRFHEVLDELLAEFGYDVKKGQIKKLKNVAIRRVRVSKALPKTYQSYLETLVTERIRENSRVKLITCVACKTRTSSLVDGRLMITSPATNVSRLKLAATTLGIENFVDVILVYHTTHMVLAFNIFDAHTSELVWARTYNSETIKSRYQKLAIDYSQVAKSRPGEDYVPDYRFLFGLGGAGIPNVAGDKNDASMINIQVRATERFNNRRTEFGLLLSLLKTTGSLLKDYPADKPEDDGSAETTEEVVTEVTPKPFETAFAFYGIYSHNLLGAVESYNETRHGFHIGAGPFFASGYLAPAFRAGWDIYFGRRFVTSFGANYLAPAQIIVEDETIETKGGAGGDLILSFNY